MRARRGGAGIGLQRWWLLELLCHALGMCLTSLGFPCLDCEDACPSVLLESVPYLHVLALAYLGLSISAVATGAALLERECCRPLACEFRVW